MTGNDHIIELGELARYLSKWNYRGVSSTGGWPIFVRRVAISSSIWINNLYFCKK